MNSPKLQSGNVKVFCRFRPFSNMQLDVGNINHVQTIVSEHHLIVKDPYKDDDLTFAYDKIFDMSAGQQDIYKEVGAPILNNILDGFNGTIIAYGQTSSGKTYTIQGSNDPVNKGIIPRIVDSLFVAIEKSPPSIEFKLKVSILELYMEKLYDLIDCQRTDLKIRESKTEGNYVQGQTEAYISDKFELMRLLNIAQKNRVTTATNMNTNSSRSHLIFHLTLNQLDSETEQAKVSNLFIVDLAGSEKVSRTGAEGKTLEQAKKINLSLTCLAKVIKSLSQRIPHIPYRDSKLTRIIQDSLGGNSKTSLILTCSAHQMNINQTVSTLRFGETAQKIKNKPKINREPTIKQLQNMILRLESKIKMKDHHILMLENHMKNRLGMDMPQIGEIKRYSTVVKDNKLYATVEMGKGLSTFSLAHDPSIEFPTANLANLTSSVTKQFLANQFENYLKSYQSTIEPEKKTSSKTLISHLDLAIPELDFKSDMDQELIDFNNADLDNFGYNTSTRNSFEEKLTLLEHEIANCRANLAQEVDNHAALKKEYSVLEESLKSATEESLAYRLRIVELEQIFKVEPKSFQERPNEFSENGQEKKQIPAIFKIDCKHHKQCPEHNRLHEECLAMQRFYEETKIEKNRLEVKIGCKNEKIKELKDLMTQIQGQMEEMAIEDDLFGFGLNLNTKIANPIRKQHILD